MEEQHSLAQALGYHKFDKYGRRRTISPAQYSRRLRALGLLPYFLVFVALVTALLKMGLLKGWDLIIDSSLLAAGSWPTKGKGRVFGYKVHTILCRWSCLPLLFVVTPANRHDGPLAIPMFAAVLLLYRLRIRAVWADAALSFIHDVLHASVNVDYNLRRQGKRFLAILFFIRQWRDLMSPRVNIERHFAGLKRYFGLKYFRVQGYLAGVQFVFRVYVAALIVASSGWQEGVTQVMASFSHRLLGHCQRQGYNIPQRLNKEGMMPNSVTSEAPAAAGASDTQAEQQAALLKAFLVTIQFRTLHPKRMNTQSGHMSQWQL